MKSEKEVLAEIKRIDKIIKPMKEMVEKKTNKNEIEEGQKGIDMLISYQSGLEFTIKATVRRKKSRYIHRFSSLHDVGGHGYGRRIEGLPAGAQ
jgi:hypothetical protein